MKNSITYNEMKKIQQYAQNNLTCKIGFTYNKLGELIIFKV